MYFVAGGLALLLLGWLWLRQTPLGWPILACGLVSLGALITGGVTGMDVPEPGTLERLMGYPITIGTAAVGLVVAQRVGRGRASGKHPWPAKAPGAAWQRAPDRSAASPGCLMSQTGPTFDYHEGIHRYIPVQRARRGSSACRMADVESIGDECLIS